MNWLDLGSFVALLAVLILVLVVLVEPMRL